MYSPYLYGRRSELLALRAIKSEGGNLTKLLPVIEPVIRDTSDVARCMEIYGKAGLKMIVVINPSQHQFHDNPEAQQKFREVTLSLFESHPSLLPGYRVHPAVTKQKADRFFKMYSGRPVAMLYSSPSLTDAEFMSMATNASVQYQVVLNQAVTSSQFSMIPKKKLIDTRDHFNRLPRNADYSGTEVFTDRHKQVGSIAAIGDYTVVGRSFEPGGGKPGAVAIHASFSHPSTGDIWLEHFVSNDVDRDVGDVASKFLQAAEKLTTAVTKRPAQFGSDAGLTQYAIHVANGTFPGLGKNKEHQIQHHVSLMLNNV